MKNNFHVIIPARMHSTRLPHKMTLDIAGVPLIVRTAQQALKSNAVQVVVATDHEEIAKVCTKYKIKNILTSVEHHNGTDRIKEAVELLDLDKEGIVINVQGDEPLIAPELINQLADFAHKEHAEVATIAHPIENEDEIFASSVVKVVLDKWSNAMYFSRAPIPFYRDGFPPNYEFSLPPSINIIRHIGIYAYRVKFIITYNQLQISPIEWVEGLEQLRALYNGHKIAVFVTDTLPASGVDTLADLQRVRQLLGHN